MIDLDNLRKLDAAATPGPWIHDLDDTHYVRHHHVRHPNGWQTLALTNLNHHDAALIAAMRNALPALLADHARLGAEAARLTRELADSEESAGSWREQAQLVAAEVARLRGLVERACDALDSSTPDWGTGPKTWRSAAIRKEAAGE